MVTTDTWIAAVKANIASYRRMIDEAVSQLSDSELFARPQPEFNSVAIILRHLGGNLHSRWTDFLTSDGEKPNRDRDSEFLDWQGDRSSLLAHFDAGWAKLTAAVEQLDATMIGQPIFVRGEQHTVADALLRSLMHTSYHVGQIVMIARLVHSGEWRWLSIPPGQSALHNKQSWGTPASRCTLGKGTDKSG
jgi:uncharacterized damage-inducible protein DinB